MVSKVGPEDLDIILKFGGGLHTRASEDEIDIREAADGQNFDIDFENRELKNRAPFDLVGTVPNAAEIRGGASLIKSDGSVSMLIQAGGKVYEWDGDATFTERGDVQATAKLRGHWRSHTWSLDDKVLITDLNLEETVMEWDGSSLKNVTFAGSFGDFYAKYCVVANERALFFACRDATTNKHMMVGSEVEDYTTISVGDKPSDSLSEADPFFMLTPDLKPINGAVEAFGSVILSTEKGRIFVLSGQSAKDFSLNEFYSGSAAAGDESLVYIGNDVIYGRAGRIESVRDTDRFGDSEADDLTKIISTSVTGFTGWRSVYNSRLNRVYLFPEGVSEVWVYDIAMKDGGLSPWMKWTTTHDLAFRPTFVMSMIDPDDGLEYVFMGDARGNLYRLEGSGSEGDGGQNAIDMTRVSKLLSAPLDSQIYNVEGWIKYRKSEAATVEIRFEYAGESIFNESLTINIPEVSNRLFFGGENYYGGNVYFGTVSGKLSRQPFFPPGQADDFQIRVSTLGNTRVRINEIGLRFRAASG
jgi:hypothetical protein